MRLIDTFSLSTRMFKTNKLRTVLTILGISVGIGAILFLVSLGYGLQKILIDQITNSDTMLSMDITTDASSPVRLDKENVGKIKNLNGIAEISPLFSSGAQVKMDDLTGDMLVNLSNVSFLRLSGVKVIRGELFKEDNENKIIISTAGLQLFNLNAENAIGKKAALSLFIPKKSESGEFTDELEVKAIEGSFEIVGVIDDNTGSYIYMPLGAVKDLEIPYFSQLKIKVKEQKIIEPVRDEIIAFGFVVTALSDTVTDANRIFNAIQMILSVFGAVALLVSAIGMFNTMTIALLERTQEIGIMKALGAARRDIWKMFLAESIIIGFLGGLGGIMIGYLGKYGVNMGINFLASSFGGQKIDLFFTPMSFVAFIMCFSTVVGFFTGLYPANRASKLNSLEALRYK